MHPGLFRVSPPGPGVGTGESMGGVFSAKREHPAWVRIIKPGCIFSSSQALRASPVTHTLCARAHKNTRTTVPSVNNWCAVNLQRQEPKDAPEPWDAARKPSGGWTASSEVHLLRGELSFTHTHTVSSHSLGFCACHSSSVASADIRNASVPVRESDIICSSSGLHFCQFLSISCPVCLCCRKEMWSYMTTEYQEMFLHPGCQTTAKLHRSARRSANNATFK